MEFLNYSMIGKSFESMQNARANGKRLGRKPTTKDDIPAAFYKHYPAYASGALNVSELARISGLSRPTVYKYLRLVGWIIAGTFFICADPWDSEYFESLTDEQAREYAETFKAPEWFVRTARGIAVVKWEIE